MDYFTLTIEKGGYDLTNDREHGIVEYTIDNSELEYVMEQIRHNLPFVLCFENDIIAISPAQCVSIKIGNGGTQNDDN